MITGPFSRFGKRQRARRANDRGMKHSDQLEVGAAIDEYNHAIDLDPSWSVPFYNLGLLYKYEGDWERSVEANLRATELDPKDQGGWWNLGIAATALERWDVARSAWRGAGLELADGEGPVDLPCGRAAIRLHANGEGEVVWSERLDPARARIASIPLADYCFGDIVLNDGAEAGYRKLGQEQVPVFECLQLLAASPLSTWIVLIVPAAGDIAALEALRDLADERGLAVEDWTSSVRILCKACSEGVPHDEHQWPAVPEGAEHRVAIAARSKDEAKVLLDDWRPAAPGAQVGEIQLEFSRD